MIDPGHGGLDPDAGAPGLDIRAFVRDQEGLAEAYRARGHAVFSPDGTAYQTQGKQYWHTDVDPPFAYFEGVGNRVQAAYLATQLLGIGVPVFSSLTGERLSWGDDELRPWESGAGWPSADVPLRTRVAHAQRVNEDHGDLLFVSLHGNALGNVSRGPSINARGVSVFTSPGVDDSDPVADAVWRSFSDRQHLPYSKRARTPDLSDGFADHEARFLVLTGARGRWMSILVEAGFFTNLRDAKQLATQEGALAVSTAIFAGIKRFVDGSPGVA